MTTSTHPPAPPRACMRNPSPIRISQPHLPLFPSPPSTPPEPGNFGLSQPVRSAALSPGLPPFFSLRAETPSTLIPPPTDSNPHPIRSFQQHRHPPPINGSQHVDVTQRARWCQRDPPRAAHNRQPESSVSPAPAAGCAQQSRQDPSRLLCHVCPPRNFWMPITAC